MSKTMYLISHGCVKSGNAAMYPNRVKGRPNALSATPSGNYLSMNKVREWIDMHIAPKTLYPVNGSHYLVSLDKDEYQKCTGSRLACTDVRIINTGKDILKNPVYAFVGAVGESEKKTRYGLFLIEFLNYVKRLGDFDKIVFLSCRVLENQTCIPGYPVTEDDLPGDSIKITSLSKQES